MVLFDRVAMQAATSTIAIDLATLGVLTDGPSTPDALCRHVQTVCRPWLTPTRCVVCDRLIGWIERGMVEHRSDGTVALTAPGRDQLRALVVAPARAHCHGLLPLLETLKLALADELDHSERQTLLRELVQLRASCFGAQVKDPASAPTLVRRCAARRVQAAALAEEALARTLERFEVGERD